jgi:hypothetical protein
MAIPISGSTGIAGVDGSASTPAVQGTDTNTGIAFPAADTVAVATGGTERMRVDSSGNVGIGTNAPGAAYRLAVAGNNTGVSIQDTGSVDTWLDFKTGSGVVQGNIYYNFTNGYMVFGTATAGNTQTERLRIDSSGNLLALTSSTLFASSHAFVNSGAAVLGLRNSSSTAGKYWQVGPDTSSSFKVYNQSSVGMFMSDGATSWSSSSDERQKNIIEPISNAVAKVGSLRAVIGSYKADQENKRRSFLIAQDVEQALPEAVTTAPDGFLGVAYTDVIPLLVAAIQELKAENDDIKARLTALEAK